MKKFLVKPSEIPSLENISDVPLTEVAEVYNLCHEMEDICERENGIGLSAVQIGVPWRLFIIKGDGTCPLIPKGKYGYFANTYYKATDDLRHVSLEGCLSIRSEDGQLRFFQVERYMRVNIIGYIFSNCGFIEFNTLLKDDQQGIIFQHEIDHHLGFLVSQIGKEVLIW